LGYRKVRVGKQLAQASQSVVLCGRRHVLTEAEEHGRYAPIGGTTGRRVDTLSPHLSCEFLSADGIGGETSGGDGGGVLKLEASHGLHFGVENKYVKGGWIRFLLAFQGVQPGVNAIQTLEDGLDYLKSLSVVESPTRVPYVLGVAEYICSFVADRLKRLHWGRDLLGLLELGDAGVQSGEFGINGRHLD